MPGITVAYIPIVISTDLTYEHNIELGELQHS